MPNRRFPPPWSIEDIGAAFVVRDKLEALEEVDSLLEELEASRAAARTEAAPYQSDTSPPGRYGRASE